MPLRPLNVGEILDGGFRAIRANPKVMFGLSLLVMGAMAVIEAVILGLFMGQVIPLLDSTTSPETLSALGAGSALGMLATGIGVYIASIVLTALLIISVSQSVIGRVATVGEVWANARGQVWRLVGLTLLLGVGWVVVVVAIAVLTALLVGGIVAALGDAAPAVAVIVVLLVILAAVVGAAFFAVRLTLSAPALMLERTGVLESLRRSWSLTRGHFWRIFGSLALAVVIVSVISYALMIPLSLGMAFTGTDMTAMVVTMIVSTVISVLVSALTTPFLAAVLALVYIDVRMRKEGLDVELARAAEAR
ncbi:glycerophosphoryl diester phosphodiesterase membrane domain-containing protein [Georgenia sp. SUBG003]|uniref:glycerophosphoryl diester phosphodiesterase membrane domain-containing protein n=1 Tax=Georgenia sp. SUBG003 TaxID=1497974 RepID=UPI000A707D1C